MMPSIRFGPGRTVPVICLVVTILTSPVVASPVAASPVAAPENNAITYSNAPSCAASTELSTVSTAESGNLSLATFVSPDETYDRLTNASALEAAREAGTLTPASEGVTRTWADEVVAYRDVIVHRIALNGSATGLLDRLAAQDRGSPTANFRALAGSDDLEIDYIGATACPPELALNASIDRRAIRAVPDHANDTLSLVFDTDRLLFHPPGGGEPTTDTFVKGHHGFSLTLPAFSGLVSENRTVQNDYQVEDATATLTGQSEGLVRVDSTDDQVVTGETTLAPGSEVGVSLHPLTANGGAITATARVNRSREFTARFDLSNASENSIYAAEVQEVTPLPVVEDGATLVAVGNASGAVVDASDQDSDGTILYGPSLTTTDGGFAVVRSASGEVVGVSEYRTPGVTADQIDLSPALTESQTVTVTLYRDANGNREFDDADVPYRTNGSVVRDTAAVRLKNGPKTTTTPPSTMTTSRPTTTTTAALPPSETRTTAVTPGPSGFGIRVAVIALLAIGFLGVRRRE